MGRQRVLRFFVFFTSGSLCVHTYHVRKITSYTLLLCDLTWVEFGSLDGCFVQLLWVVQHSYEYKVDTEKQRQHRHDDARLTESGNARSEQLLVMPTESLTNREWLPGELQNVEGQVGFGYELFQKAMEDSYWASLWVQWIAPHPWLECSWLLCCSRSCLGVRLVELYVSLSIWCFFASGISELKVAGK